MVGQQVPSGGGGQRQQTPGLSIYWVHDGCMASGPKCAVTMLRLRLLRFTHCQLVVVPGKCFAERFCQISMQMPALFVNGTTFVLTAYRPLKGQVPLTAILSYKHRTTRNDDSLSRWLDGCVISRFCL